MHAADRGAPIAECARVLVAKGAAGRMRVTRAHFSHSSAAVLAKRRTKLLVPLDISRLVGMMCVTCSFKVIICSRSLT